MIASVDVSTMVQQTLYSLQNESSQVIYTET